jgi:hypothetical protein
MKHRKMRSIMTEGFMQKLTLSLLLLTLALGAWPLAALAQEDTAAALDCLASPNGGGCQAGLPADQYQMLLDEMLMTPYPTVRQLPVNQAEIARFGYRRLVNEGGTTYHNAPNWAPIGTVDPGFTFISVYSIRDGWVEINPGQWVPESATAVTRPSTFSGVLLSQGEMKYQMAWVLIPQHPAPYPGAATDSSRPRMERYTRLNIFETVELDGWRWYLVGPDAWIKQTNVAKIQFTERPEGVKGRWIAVDLYEQVLVAYEEDTPVFATLVSSGLPDWATNEGTFQTYWRLTTGYMTGSEGQSDYYLVEGVPYTLYFDNAISLHGTYWHDSFGYRHSHGCVNMTITDSHWVFQWTADAGFDYPYVHVFSSGEYVNG